MLSADPANDVSGIFHGNIDLFVHKHNKLEGLEVPLCGLLTITAGVYNVSVQFHPRQLPSVSVRLERIIP